MWRKWNWVNNPRTLNTSYPNSTLYPKQPGAKPGWRSLDSIVCGHNRMFSSLAQASWKKSDIMASTHWTMHESEYWVTIMDNRFQPVPPVNEADWKAAFLPLQSKLAIPKKTNEETSQLQTSHRLAYLYDYKITWDLWNYTSSWSKLHRCRCWHRQLKIPHVCACGGWMAFCCGSCSWQRWPALAAACVVVKKKGGGGRRSQGGIDRKKGTTRDETRRIP